MNFYFLPNMDELKSHRWILQKEKSNHLQEIKHSTDPDSDDHNVRTDGEFKITMIKMLKDLVE